MKNLKTLLLRLFVLLNVGIMILLLTMNLGYNYYLGKNLWNAAAYTGLAIVAIYSLATGFYFMTSSRLWKWGAPFFLVVIAIIILTSRRAIYDIFPQWGHELYESIERASLQEYILIMIPRFFYYSLLAILLVVNYRLGMVFLHKMRIEQDKAAEEMKRVAAEQKAWQMELVAYGAYMNPHFLFNELKDIRAELQELQAPRAKRLVRRIEALERMAHYNAVNVVENRRVVVVELELEQLKRYLRARHKTNKNYPAAVLELQGTPAGHKIVPMVLVFLAENAFTHGDLRVEPLRIHITLQADALQASFRNRIPAEKPDTQSIGSGLAITRRRLELAMPGKFTLDSESGFGEYRVTLTILQ